MHSSFKPSWLLFSLLACLSRPGWSVEVSTPEAPSCHPDGTPITGLPHPNTVPATSPAVRQPVMSAGPYIPTTPENLEVSDKPLSNGQRQKIVLFKNILIDRIYPSMGGPWSRAYVPMDLPGAKPSHIWITRYKAEVLNSSTGKPAQEFMCHTKLDLDGGPQAPATIRGVHSQFVISQGQNEAAFPKGYGLRVESHPERKIDLNIMVLNNNESQEKYYVNFKATVDYVDDKTAKKKKMISLFERGTSVVCPLTQCENASYSGAGTTATGHWMVPPGRQEVRTAVSALTPYDTTVHYMMMHLHPYAESMELRNLTTGKTLWKGYAKNDGAKAILLTTDHFSSRQGLPIFKDHHYEIVSVYHNTTSQPVDAMASLWMYFKEKS